MKEQTQSKKKLNFFQRVLRACIDRGFLDTIKRKIDHLIRKICIRLVTAHTKIEEKKVIFLNFSGVYDCNTKYIAEEMLRREDTFDLYWGIYTPEQAILGEFPETITLFPRKTYDCYKELASAKVIIDNGVNLATLMYKKKKGQILVETWHGSIGIKKFGRAANADHPWHHHADNEGKMTDLILSGSAFEDEVYRAEFWKKTPILRCGHPRNDIFFRSEEELRPLREQIYKRYSLPSDAKLCLYAPTFRDGNILSVYNLDYQRLQDALRERFGGNWIILVRFHHFTKKKPYNFSLPNGVVGVNDYPDIQELLACIDIGITDYSSWICEYMLRRKAGFTYATDKDEYATSERKLFFTLEELPFPTATDMDELVNNVLTFDEDAYRAACDDFLAANGSADNGTASKQAVDEILHLMKK